MLNKSLTVVVLPVVLGLSACGPSQNMAQQITEKIPVHTAVTHSIIIDTNTLNKPDSEQVDPSLIESDLHILKSKIEDEGGTVDLSRANLGIVKIDNISETAVQTIKEDLRLDSLTGEVFENKYYPNLIDRVNPFDQVLAEADKTIRDYCTAKGETMSIDLVLSDASKAMFDAAGVMKMGSGAVEITATDDTNQATKYLYIISGPEGSKYKGELIEGSSTITISPDLTGEFSVFVILATDDKKCIGNSFEWGVTYVKPDAFKKTAARAFTDKDKIDFHHLSAISAQEAWTVTKGKGFTIAIVDSGVNYNHVDLSANVVDANGVVGFNAYSTGVSAMDDNAHGTHVAGLAASPVFGVAPEAKILPVKGLASTGGGDLASIKAALRYAALSSAQIINASFGGTNKEFGEGMKAEMDMIEKAGKIFVAASGNGDSKGNPLDVDVVPHYPSVLPFANIISVAATKTTGALASYSNFGIIGVDVAAPGGDRDKVAVNPPVEQGLKSSYYHPEVQSYVRYSGTSMATPVTAGTVALMLAAKQGKSIATYKQVLMDSGRSIAALSGKVVSGKLINAKAAVDAIRAQ